MQVHPVQPRAAFIAACAVTLALQKGGSVCQKIAGFRAPVEPAIGDSNLTDGDFFPHQKVFLFLFLHSVSTSPAARTAAAIA